MTTGLRVSRKRNNALENRNWVSVPNTDLVGKCMCLSHYSLLSYSLYPIYKCDVNIYDCCTDM